jgi:hypothetical protein
MERPFSVLGGSHSHRGLWRARHLDSDKLLGNLDVRYDLLAEPTLFRVTLVGFLDVGRVFPTSEFTLTSEDLKWGGGAGLIVQLFRAAIIGGTVGIGPENRLLALFHTSWTY